MPKFLAIPGLLVVMAFAACGGSNASSAAHASASTSTAASTASPSVPTTTTTTYPETADRYDGVQLWNNNKGSQASGSLSFGTVVLVVCLAPNKSEMQSADPGFYQFMYDGRTLYAISNEFANGDPLGQSGSTTVDPNVPRC